jgi:hypothetical protein
LNVLFVVLLEAVRVALLPEQMVAMPEMDIVGGAFGLICREAVVVHPLAAVAVTV